MSSEAERILHIVDGVVDDCPECNTELVDRDLVFNLKTGDVACYCTGCPVKVHFILEVGWRPPSNKSKVEDDLANKEQSVKGSGETGIVVKREVSYQYNLRPRKITH